MCVDVLFVDCQQVDVYVDLMCCYCQVSDVYCIMLDVVGLELECFFVDYDVVLVQVLLGGIEQVVYVFKGLCVIIGVSGLVVYFVGIECVCCVGEGVLFDYFFLVWCEELVVVWCDVGVVLQ